MSAGGFRWLVGTSENEFSLPDWVYRTSNSSSNLVAPAYHSDLLVVLAAPFAWIISAILVHSLDLGKCEQSEVEMVTLKMR